MTAEDIRIILAEVAARRGGPPRRMRSDNGPGFAADVVRSWLEETGSGALYIAPASPWQNGYAESFHSKLREGGIALVPAIMRHSRSSSSL